MSYKLIDWKLSKHALSKLESIISCKLCEKSFTRKFVKILTTCGHLFCGKCIRDIEKGDASAKCPSCNVDFKAWNVAACAPIKDAIDIINELTEFFSTPLTLSEDEKSKDLQYLHRNLTLNTSDSLIGSPQRKQLSEPLISTTTSGDNVVSSPLRSRSNRIDRAKTSSSDSKSPILRPSEDLPKSTGAKNKQKARVTSAVKRSKSHTSSTSGYPATTPSSATPVTTTTIPSPVSSKATTTRTPPPTFDIDICSPTRVSLSEEKGNAPQGEKGNLRATRLHDNLQRNQQEKEKGISDGGGKGPRPKGRSRSAANKRKSEDSCADTASSNDTRPKRQRRQATNRKSAPISVLEWNSKESSTDLPAPKTPSALTPKSSNAKASKPVTPIPKSSITKASKPSKPTPKSSCAKLSKPAPSTSTSNRTSMSKSSSPTPKSSRSKGSNIDSKNRKGETKLQVACIKGNVGIVTELLENGANPNVQDYSKWTPLHEACDHGYREIAERLLSYGAVVNAPGYDNNTPLHDAVRNNRLACVQLLVAHNADVHARNKEGSTPLSLATNAEMKNALHPSESITNKILSQSIQSKGCLTISNVPRVLLLTGVNSAMRKAINKVGDIVNASFTHEFTDKVTHIVSTVNKDGRCPRTMKYLQGVLTGKWIVRYEWLEDCLTKGENIPEHAYEIVSAISSSVSRQNVDVPKKGREMSYLKKPPLFDGCSFYLKGEFKKPPNRASVEQLLKLGGATILKRQPKPGGCDPSFVYHSREDAELTSCATFTVTSDLCNPRMLDATLCECNVAWIMECVAALQLVDPVCYVNDKL